MLTNSQGQPHTAKWGTILSSMGGVIVIMAACVPNITGLTWGTAIPFALLLFGITGIQAQAMVSKNKNGG